MVARCWLVLMCVGLLMACGSPPAPTAQSVLELFRDAGLEVANPHWPLFANQGTFPRTFTDGITFDLPSLGTNGVGQPRHGSILVCEAKQGCDTIYAYLETISGLLGPYYYQSSRGTVVVFLDSKLSRATAARYEQIVRSLPN
jgi:hypothetical protein